MTPPAVSSVHKSSAHCFSKTSEKEIVLVAGCGVSGDAHYGALVKHRSRVDADPAQPNLRQVHLIHAELLEELGRCGHAIAPGALGENITTRDLDLLALPAGTMLKIGGEALVAITGLRNPCRQIEEFQPELLSKVVCREPDGTVVRKAGVMGIVVVGGVVRVGDIIEVGLPPGDPILPGCV